MSATTKLSEAEGAAHAALITLREAAVAVVAGPACGLTGLRFMSRLDDALCHAETLLDELRHLTGAAREAEGAANGDVL